MAESKELVNQPGSTEQSASTLPSESTALAKPGESKELAHQVPTNEAIIRRYADAIAKSPTNIQRGEAVLLDRHGVAFGRGRYTRLVNVWRAAIYGGLVGSVALALTGAWLPAALLYVGIASPLWLVNYRGTGKLMAIDVIVRQGQLEEGQRRLDAVPELRRRNPAVYGWIAGRMASHRGDHAGAIKWWREALPRMKGVFREIIKLSIVKALALDGQIKEAKVMVGDVQLPREAVQVVSGHVLARIILALHDPDGLPQGDELHEWSRMALAYSHAGVELTALAWAFERAGDDDMARFLVSEAVDRMHYPYLATWWPALQHWFDDHKPKAGDADPYDAI